MKCSIFGLAAAVILLLTICCETVFSSGGQESKDNAVYDIVVYGDPDNALRIIVEWKTAVASDSSVEYREYYGTKWVTTPIVVEASKVHKTVIAGLKENTHYFVRPVSNGVAGSTRVCVTRSLPSDIPLADPVFNNTANNNIIITGVPDYKVIIAVNSRGDIVWYHMDSDGGMPGQFYMKDGEGNEKLYYQTSEAIKTVNYKGVEKMVLDVWSLGEMAHHDFLITPEGNFMYLSHESVYENGEWWKLDVIRERNEEGELVWEWRCADHMDALGGFAVSNQQQIYMRGYGYDLTHANSVDLYSDSSGNRFVLMSMRNLHSVIKIDYATKAVVWRLGTDLDFAYIGSQPTFLEWFLCQHSARHLPNGSLLLFDNGNTRFSENASVENFSRCIVYGLNEKNMTAWNRWSFGMNDFADHGGNVIFSKDESFLILFPISIDNTYSSLIRVNSFQERIWETKFHFNNNDSKNKLAGLLEVESLYDLRD